VIFTGPKNLHYLLSSIFESVHIYAYLCVGPFQTLDYQLLMSMLVLLNLFNLCCIHHISVGKVYVRYLDPVRCDEAKDRDGMLRLVRRRMLG
jgi:hypothetical protein